MSHKDSAIPRVLQSEIFGGNVRIRDWLHVRQEVLLIIASFSPYLLLKSPFNALHWEGHSCHLSLLHLANCLRVDPTLSRTPPQNKNVSASSWFGKRSQERESEGKRRKSDQNPLVNRLLLWAPRLISPNIFEKLRAPRIELYFHAPLPDCH